MANRKIQILLILGLALSASCVVALGILVTQTIRLNSPAPQPDCRAVTELFREMDNLDVVLSSCDFEEFSFSSSGRMLAVQAQDSTYVRDLQTGATWQIDRLANGAARVELQRIFFLTDDLMFSKRTRPPTAFNYRTGKQIPLREITQDQISEFHDADHVFIFITNDSVGLQYRPQDPRIEGFYLHGPYEQILPYLREGDIEYSIDPSLAHVLEIQLCNCLLSPSGKFSFRDDGIYLEETGQKLVDTIAGFHPRGWLFDDSGVILTKPETCLQRSFSGDVCEAWSPKLPLLKLKVPDEYLSIDQ